MTQRFSIACSALAFVALSAGCHPSPPSAPVAATAPAPVAQTPPSSPVAPAASKTPVRDAVESLLAKQVASSNPILPPGVRLLGAKLSDGVVTLDFSPEFDKLANMGDSAEGEAQNALCAALAPIPNVEKLRVTVAGRPFDSQMADWSTPFPVRDRTAASQDSEKGQ